MICMYVYIIGITTVCTCIVLYLYKEEEDQSWERKMGCSGARTKRDTRNYAFRENVNELLPLSNMRYASLKWVL